MLRIRILLNTYLASATRRRTGPPRPSNAWILFRQSVAAEVKKDLQITYQPHVTQIASPRWRALDLDEKAFWQGKAKDAKRAHALKYPNYKFKPQTVIVERKKRQISNQKERKELNTAIGAKMARRMDVSPELEALKELQADNKKKGRSMTPKSSAHTSKASILDNGSCSTTSIPSLLMVPDTDTSVSMAINVRLPLYI